MQIKQQNHLISVCNQLRKRRGTIFRTFIKYVHKTLEILDPSPLVRMFPVLLVCRICRFFGPARWTPPGADILNGSPLCVDVTCAFAPVLVIQVRYNGD